MIFFSKVLRLYNNMASHLLAPPTTSVESHTRVNGHPPQPDFNYDESSKKTWTQTVVRKAFPSDQEKMIKRLFDRAKELVERYNLYPEVFRRDRYPQTEAKDTRDHFAKKLLNEFHNDIKIQGHDDFALRLCKGVLVFASRPGKRVSVSGNLEEAIRNVTIMLTFKSKKTINLAPRLEPPSQCQPLRPLRSQLSLAASRTEPQSLPQPLRPLYSQISLAASRQELSSLLKPLRLLQGQLSLADRVTNKWCVRWILLSWQGPALFWLSGRDFHPVP